MDDLVREYIVSYYTRALRMHGDRPEAVRWTQKGQIMHYKALLDIAPDINGRSILDYGCGKGDFYQFLKVNNINVQYTGFDINGELIRLAQQKYPECRFRVFDIERDELDEDFDFIFLCGVFNLKIQGLEETIKNTLLRLFPHCKIGLAFNALSAHNPSRDFELYYIYPEEIFTFAVKELSPFVILRHDRIPYDFTLFVYRDINRFMSSRSL